MAIDMDAPITGDYSVDLYTFRKPEIPNTIED